MIAITTSDNITHLVASEAAIASYSSSAATVAALQAAYDSGHCKPYTPPAPQPAPLEPDWKTFRLALLKSKSFRLWSELLPNSWREDLKMAAMVGNAEALQDIYNYCKTLSPPLPAAVAEWQKLATQNHIPVTF